jgi:hypothetical protein
MNIHGNFEHYETQLVFSPTSKKVKGVQLQTGEVQLLGPRDIEHCHKFHFEYKDDCVDINLNHEKNTDEEKYQSLKAKMEAEK